MLKGLWKLTWVEIKVFLREPLGVVSSLVLPALIYWVLARQVRGVRLGTSQATGFNVAVFAALLIAIGSALSLIAIVSIYRDGGILKRLRATPLSPLTILGAHVVVKLVFTVAAMGILVVSGRRFFPGAMDIDLVRFTLALLLSTLSILSVGFVIASLVRTARFAQPLASLLFYTALGISGVFVPVDRLSTGLKLTASVLPTTHAAALMEGVWQGVGWVALWPNVLGLVSIFVICCTISARLFRWE